MEWTDEAAAVEARRGNQFAFRLLVERHSRAVFRVAYRMCGNEQDAEDLVQETFLRAYRQLGGFNGHSAFGTWLYRICANCALDLLRSRKARREIKIQREGEGGPRWLDSVAAAEPGPERLLQSGQIAGLLKPAIEQLTDMERAAFVLRHYEGCRIEEIARALGVEPGAAKHSVFRAVQKLRRALEPALGTTR